MEVEPHAVLLPLEPDALHDWNPKNACSDSKLSYGNPALLKLMLSVLEAACPTTVTYDSKHPLKGVCCNAAPVLRPPYLHITQNPPT